MKFKLSTVKMSWKVIALKVKFGDVYHNESYEFLRNIFQNFHKGRPHIIY